jgi:hypothetical protein
MISLPMTMTRSGTIKDRSRADAALPLRSQFQLLSLGYFRHSSRTPALAVLSTMAECINNGCLYAQ